MFGHKGSVGKEPGGSLAAKTSDAVESVGAVFSQLCSPSSGCFLQKFHMLNKPQGSCLDSRESGFISIVDEDQLLS